MREYRFFGVLDLVFRLLEFVTLWGGWLGLVVWGFACFVVFC